MKKKELEKLADAIVAMTYQFTNVYCEDNKVKEIDKQLWAALHVGFFAGAKYSGIDEEDISQALEIARIKISVLEGLKKNP